MKVALSWPVQTVPLELLLRLTVYEGAAGVRGVRRRGRGAGGVEGDVVEDEARLEAGVLGPGEGEAHGLARERRHVERLLYVAGGLVEVRVRRQCRTADLRRQLVVRGGRGRLGGVDVQPEGEGGTAAAGRDRDALREGVGVRTADTVQPGEAGAAVGALPGTAGDHRRRRLGPGRSPALETTVGDHLGRGAVGGQWCRGRRGCCRGDGEQGGGQRDDAECARGEGLVGGRSHTKLL